jgi:hypothetical protein
MAVASRDLAIPIVDHEFCMLPLRKLTGPVYGLRFGGQNRGSAFAASLLDSPAITAIGCHVCGWSRHDGLLCCYVLHGESIGILAQVTVGVLQKAQDPAA